jgi:hypothetical protein
MQRYFALDMPAMRFARNTLVASLLGLLPLLVFYITLTPEFTAQLLSGGPALGRFLRQVLTNGLTVVFVINYVGFFLFAWAVDRHPDGRQRSGGNRGLSLSLRFGKSSREAHDTAESHVLRFRLWRGAQ